MSNDLTFIQVGDLAKGITENILPHSNQLAGASLQLNNEDGSAIRIRFESAQELSWQFVDGTDQAQNGRAHYRATSPREQIFLVDYIDPNRKAASTSLILDLRAGAATVVQAALPNEAQTRVDAFSRVQQGLELTPVSMRFVRAAVDQPFDPDTHPHKPTGDLVGKRIKYVYSRTEVYEHIYLNKNLYTWHCLQGSEKGLADTDRCHYRRVADGLYLFVWREKVVPTLGLVIIDLERMKTTGKLFGYEGDDFGRLTNAPVGAYASLLNVTDH
jgi:hypothetical protein